jgi:PST family polysaccharide transporter
MKPAKISFYGNLGAWRLEGGMPRRARASLRRDVNSYFGENKPHAALGRDSLHSGLAFLVARGLNTFVQIGSTILLARLLSPHDYGLVAMVSALVGFAPMLIDLGTNDAVVQRKSISRYDITSLFWLKVAIAGTLTLLLVGGSGYIADFYGEPALTGIALVSAITLMVTALSAQHYTLMLRAMQFKRIALIEIAANVISSVIAIVMAYTGWGYWALVAKPVLAIAVSSIAVWASCPWLPGRPQFTNDAKQMVGFGLGITGFTMTDYVARSADRVALGYFYGAVPLGYFQNASLIYDNAMSLTGLHTVAVSGLSKLRGNLDELRRAWATALSTVSFYFMLAFAGLAVTGQDFVVMLLGSKWEPAGIIVCIFGVKGIADVVERTLGWLHVTAGRSDRWMRWGVYSAIFQLAALVIGLPFGLVGVATAYALAMFFLFLPALAYAGKPLGIGASDVLRAVGPQMVAALGAVAIGVAAQLLFMADYGRLARFLVSGSICTVAYMLIAVGVFRVTRPLQLALSLLHDLNPMRRWRSS